MERLGTTFRRDLKIWQPRVEDFLEVKLGEVKVQSILKCELNAHADFYKDILKVVDPRNTKTPKSRMFALFFHYGVSFPLSAGVGVYRELTCTAIAYRSKAIGYSQRIGTLSQNTSGLIHELSHIANIVFDPPSLETENFAYHYGTSYLREAFAEQVTSVVGQNYGLTQITLCPSYQDSLSKFRAEGGNLTEGRELKRFMIEKLAEARDKQVHPKSS